MTQKRATANSRTTKEFQQQRLAESYYGLLGLHPSASVQEIRQAYRELSKLYHPDTTTLQTAIATEKFQKLNEAYATLSNPERRSRYDRSIGYSSVAVIQPLPSLNRPQTRSSVYSSSAYLDPTDRPLSPGEIFAVFILGLTFVGCLVLAIAIGLTRGENASHIVVVKSAPAAIVRSSRIKDDQVQPDSSTLSTTLSERVSSNHPIHASKTPPHADFLSPL